jgi:hypothetical protein
LKLNLKSSYVYLITLSINFITVLTVTTNASENGLERYQKAADYCAGQNVRKLDDGITSAEVIADVMLTECRNTLIGLWKSAIKGKSNAWIEGYNRAQLKQFTAYVLMHRTGHVE